MSIWLACHNGNPAAAAWALVKDWNAGLAVKLSIHDRQALAEAVALLVVEAWGSPSPDDSDPEVTP